jgi:hypothetical protein
MIPLPDGAITDQAKAKFKDGVLEIRRRGAGYYKPRRSPPRLEVAGPYPPETAQNSA